MYCLSIEDKKKNQKKKEKRKGMSGGVRFTNSFHVSLFVVLKAQLSLEYVVVRIDWR